MFVSRERRPEDRYLRYKLAAFGLGAVLAIAGIAFGNDLLITVAIAVLALGLVLRILGRRKHTGGDDPSDVD